MRQDDSYLLDVVWNIVASDVPELERMAPRETD